MLRKHLLIVGVAAWSLGACARPAVVGEPEPLPPDVPMGEEEVREFLGLERERSRFLAARADEDRAEAEADNVSTENALERAPTDPAIFDIPLHYNERVQYWMDFFQERHAERFGEYLVRMGRYEPYIRSRLRERGMPEDLIYLALIESGFNPVARSHAAAVGIWQFVAGTGRQYGLEISSYVDERRDPVKATDAALDYLEHLYERFGSWYLAAAAYNTGENRVERILRQHAGVQRGDDALFWEIDKHLPRETRNYVPKFLAAAILGKSPHRFGFDDITPHEPLAFDVVTIPDATDLEVIAEAAGVETAEIVRLNPQFLKRVTPPGRKVEVRVPEGRGPTFVAAYAEIPPSRRVRVLEHTVRPGETLSHIARRYGTTVRAIQDANRIRNPHAVRAGRRLIVRLGPDAMSATVASTAAQKPAARASAGSAGARKGSGNEGTVYVVRPGDSLWSIARRHNVSVDQIRMWNQIGENDHIRPGEELRIGDAKARVVVYHVQPGDTLWSIAQRHGITADQLMKWNDMGRNTVIRPGDRVEVPLGG